ncbi:MAG: extracellular solute-binding protein [Oscillospiraceae bacterium]|jgi:putative aldouronate transport system substrate-binding protein|nr:extracellular solute-binding protein [Oscillospiraceae bacterium]
MKKLLSLLVAIAILAALCATAAADPIVTEPLTLKVMEYTIENQQVDYDTMWFYQELEKNTGIHIEWESVKDGDWETQRNLMFISGDYPDVIMRGSIDYEEYGVAQGILLPLDDLIPLYMPNYAARLEMNGVKDAMVASDGHMYYIGNLIAQGVNHDGNHYINKAWLDKLGLEIPTTIDELTEVLRAFKTQDPNGNGIADEIPFSGGDLIHQTQGLYTHFANFGVPLNRYTAARINAEDKVEFIGDVEGFRQAVEWLHLCYEEGLLDKEAITQDSNVWGEKMNQGIVGYTTYLRLINTALTPEIAAQYVSILPPKADGLSVAVPEIMELPGDGASLTVANKHVEETLRWLDAQFETETMMVAYNGPIKEGGPIDPTIKINDEGKYEVIYIPENNGLYQYVPVYMAQFFAPADYYAPIYQMAPHRIERYNTSQDYANAGVLEPKSFNYLTKLVKLPSEEATEAARLFTDLDAFLRESITTFITAGVTDASWEAFKATAKAVGSERYVELYQAGYDTFLENNK